MVISNTKIKKLGDRIRGVNCDRNRCSEEDIRLLQAYRLEHKESLIHVFDVVSKISKKVHSGRMVAFRLKKIDTILSKLIRTNNQSEGKMELHRMWDVAGCRVIVQSETAINKIVNLLNEEFEVKRPRDYLTKPAKDGYRGYHLYVKPKGIQNAKMVEVQLRTINHHLWATLVEVIDVVFDTKIKEGDNSIPDLNTFLRVYSNWDTATINEKKESFLIESKHNLYSKLSEVFTDNILELRSDWIHLSEYGMNEPYILFNVDQDSKKVSFKTFKTIEEAEEHYLNDFMRQEGDFMVARLDVKYFVQLAFVYANYVLSNHRFLDVWLNDVLELVKNEKIDFNFVLKEIKPRTSKYENEVIQLQKNEAQIIDFFEGSQTVNEKTLVQLKKWKEERDNDLIQRKNLLKEIDKEIIKREKIKAQSVQDFILMIIGFILIIGIIISITKSSRKK